MARSTQRYLLLTEMAALMTVYLMQPVALGQDARPPAQEKKPMMQCPMMSALGDLRLYPSSPAVLLAHSKRLGLNDEQKKQLREIEKATQEKARGILTADQQKELGEMPDRPLSLMELSMPGMTSKPQKKDAGPMCPMCEQMMRQKMQPKEGQSEKK